MEKELIKRIEKAAALRGVAPSTYTRLAVNDSKIHKKLIAGGSITLATFRKLNEFMDKQGTAQ